MYVIKTKYILNNYVLKLKLKLMLNNKAISLIRGVNGEYDIQLENEMKIWNRK